MRERRNYGPLKDEHGKPAAEQNDQQARVESAQSRETWDEQLDAKYAKRMDELSKKYDAGRLSSRELVYEQRKLDNQQMIEIKQHEKEERAAKEKQPGNENERPKQSSERMDRLERLTNSLADKSMDANRDGQTLDHSRERD